MVVQSLTIAIGFLIDCCTKACAFCKLEVLDLPNRLFSLEQFLNENTNSRSLWLWRKLLFWHYCFMKIDKELGTQKCFEKKTRPVQAEFQVRRWQTSIKEQCSNTLCVRATARSGQTGDALGLSFHLLYVGYELTYDYVACYCSAHWFSGYHNCGDQSMAVHGGRRWLHYQWTMLSMTRSTS